jgi:hypothetical protein
LLRTAIEATANGLEPPFAEETDRVRAVRNILDSIEFEAGKEMFRQL